MPEDIFEKIELYLPKYLTPSQKNELFSELEKFPDNQNFYLFAQQAELLQGDGWRGLVAINFYTLERKLLSGVVLSNSCDIDPKNPQVGETKILFCPLLKLSAYVEQLKNAEKTTEQIDNILSAIRSQRVTTIFYLPSCASIIEESFIPLDDIHAHPLQDFMQQSRSRLFSLNQYAFYIFLIKLSIHFSRFQEDVQRFSTTG
jgi:hypothetical protein